MIRFVRLYAAAGQPGKRCVTILAIAAALAVFCSKNSSAVAAIGTFAHDLGLTTRPALVGAIACVAFFGLRVALSAAIDAFDASQFVRFFCGARLFRVYR